MIKIPKGESPDLAQTGTRSRVYLCLNPDGLLVQGTIRQNTGRCLRVASFHTQKTSTELVNSGYTIVPGKLIVLKDQPVALHI
jgi:hypothetical protein